eukprot:gene5624-5587_t
MFLRFGARRHAYGAHGAPGDCVQPRGRLWVQQRRLPAFGENGTYSALLYAGRAVKLLEAFGERAKANASARFFLYLPWHDVHDPLQAPQEYFHPYYWNDTCGTPPRLACPAQVRTEDQTLNAMASAMDSGMKNVTDTHWLLPGY